MTKSLEAFKPKFPEFKFPDPPVHITAAGEEFPLPIQISVQDFVDIMLDKERHDYLTLFLERNDRREGEEICGRMFDVEVLFSDHDGWAMARAVTKHLSGVVRISNRWGLRATIELHFEAGWGSLIMGDPDRIMHLWDPVCKHEKILAGCLGFMLGVPLCTEGFALPEMWSEAYREYDLVIVEEAEKDPDTRMTAADSVKGGLGR